VIITTDNSPEFTGKTLHARGYHHGVKLELNQLDKPNDNACIESLNEMLLRDKGRSTKCLIRTDHALKGIRRREQYADQPQKPG